MNNMNNQLHRDEMNVTFFHTYHMMYELVTCYIQKNLHVSNLKLHNFRMVDALLQAVNQNQVDIVMINSASLFDSQFSNVEIRNILTCLCDNSRVTTILFTHNIEPMLLRKILAMGVDIILSSADSPEEIGHALDYMHSRSSPLSYVSKSLRESLNKHGSMLTPKEWEVLNLINQGFTLSEISAMKCRAMSTISTQKHNAMSKLQLKSNSDLLRFMHLNALF